MKVLYFDCFSGAAGDMIVGALIDAGVPFEGIRHALGSLSLDTDAVWVERVDRAGISATKFCVRGEAGHDGAHDPGHGHTHTHADTHPHSHEPPHQPSHDRPYPQSHEHPHGHTHEPPRQQRQPQGRAAVVEGAAHGHRTLAEIFALVDRSLLSGDAKDRAKALFARLGEVEGAVHGTPADQVHLHEVGALDSIVDVVGAVWAMDALGASHIVSSPLNVGSGTIRSAHGLYPVPAPATLRLLEGIPMYAGPQRAEMVTPTGALLVTAYATEYGPIPAMRMRSVGYGAGARNFPDAPNVLRVLVGDSDASASSHTVVVIEAEIDDMNPQIFGVVMERLLAEGALDVFYTPVQMKKNRPGTLMSVVAAPRARERLTATIFRETTTIGVRYREMTRECLDRAVVVVTTPFGDVPIKVARRDGVLLNASPEFDECVRLARHHDRPVKDVQAAAMRAFLD